MASERELFEKAVYAWYVDLKSKGWQDPNEGDLSPESLFWLQPDGLYGVTNLNAAWWAWQAATRAANAANVPVWVSTLERMPASETPVLCQIKDGLPRVLSRELEDDGYFRGYEAFWYWDDPSNPGVEIEDDQVTHWMSLPNKAES